MKEVFTAPSVIPCDFLKAVLEANGISSFIKNERGSTIAEVADPAPSSTSLSLAWPEVWVQDEDFQHAGEIVSECQNKKSQVNMLRSFRRDMRRERIAFVQLRGLRN
jgi:hypothetical protein